MLSQTRLISVGCAVFICGLVLPGCGGPPAETLPGHQIKGKVTINGKEPGTYATVEFASVSNPSETGSAGFDPSGNFAGRVPLGKCKVAIKVGGGSSGPPGGAGGGGSNPYGKGMAKGGSSGGPPGGGSSGGPPQMKGAEIPKKFTDLKTSGITVDVVEGQDVNIDFK